MVRDRLSEKLKEAGRRLLSATDELGLQAQGAMWVYSHSLQEWRYYLVTSLVDTLGRRRTYGLLLDAFERLSLPEEMTPEDIHLGSPRDAFFHMISSIVHADNSMFEFTDCIIQVNDVATTFDGVIYRSVLEPPAAKVALAIEKKFTKRVRELTAQSR